MILLIDANVKTHYFVLISKHSVQTADLKFANCFEMDNGRRLSVTVFD